MSARSTKTPFKYMSNFKAVAADWEYFSSLSDEGQLYCLSEQQVYAIMVQLEYVGWLTRWYNTDDITQTTVDRVKSDIMEALMSCVDVSILVDQANDNLITATVNRAIQSQLLRDALAAEYDGNPTSINPNAPTTTFGPAGDRFEALCAGLMAFVYQFARAQADSVRAGQVGGLAAIALIAALLIPGLNIFFLVGASIAVLIGLGTVGVTTEIAIQALTDTEALDNVVCCMVDRLDGLAVSEANWLTALSACSFPGGSHEQIISDFLLPTLSDNYLTILNILGQAYTGVIDGEQLPTCPACVEPPDPQCDDLEASNGGWPDTAQTKWWSGSGLGPTGAGGVQQFLINHSQELVNRVVVEVRFYFNMPFSNVKVTMGILGNAIVSTGPGDVIIMNEASHPSLFPLNTASAGAVQVASNAASFIAPTGIRMIQSCWYIAP